MNDRRDRNLPIVLPTQGIRDEVIARVAKGVAAMMSPPDLSIRDIQVIEGAPAPTLFVTVRPRRALGELSDGAVVDAVLASVQRLAAGADLSGIRVWIQP